MGTERHESRRIDNQLRGRSGRQGDPGSSQFFLSLEDDLLRIFESERVASWWDRVGVEEGEAIENRLLSRVIENAQTKVEARNFDIRKHLLDYDDVMNKQRKAFYAKRREALAEDGVHEEILDMAEGAVVALLDAHWPEQGDPEPEAINDLVIALEAQFGVSIPPGEPPMHREGEPLPERDGAGRAVLDRLTAFLEDKKKRCDALAEEHAEIGYPRFIDIERDILLQILDAQWKDHLHTMDGLREGIGLRGYASRDPKLEYQREGYALFQDMNNRIDLQALDVVFKFALPDPAAEVARRAPPPPLPGVGPGASAGTPQRGPVARGERPGKAEKVGRNEPCPCGSGKKYKKCCGAA
jgi:preprotein translocase subunit SecA